MKRYFAVPGILLLTLASGCFYELRDDFTECKIGIANHFAAKHAYREMGVPGREFCCRHSFKEGFFAGFIAVADGGTGCVPAVPDIKCHNHMWMDFGCSDDDKMQAWYDGYELGASAAKSEGMCDANRVMTRMPPATPIDYSMSAQNQTDAFPQDSSSDASSGPALPPSPILDTNVTDGPEARRIPNEVVE